MAPDSTRAPLGFADPFPIEYARLLAAPDYWPDIPSLIDDYLAFNPTRNRDLDMLPLLLHFDEARSARHCRARRSTADPPSITVSPTRA